MKASDLAQDIRLSLRSLARDRGFTAAALLSLALGIGANTALFSIVYGVLLRPLPYQDSNRILRLSEFHPGATSAVSGPLLTSFTFHAWKGGQTIEDIATFRSQRFSETSGAEPVKIAGASMSPAGFRLLGVKAIAGRLPREGDGAENAPDIAVISEGLWRERFGGDPSAIGRTLVLDGRPHIIVGVTPKDFYFPEREGRIWTVTRPSVGSADPTTQSVSFFGAFTKLKEGFTPQQAAEEGTIVARAQKRPPVVDAVLGKGGPVTVRADRWLDDLTARIRPALLMFGAGAVFILLIACSNVASLQLTRGVSRQRELAVRTALGASRTRLLAPMMIEGLVLAMIGGALGLSLAKALVHALPALAPRAFPRVDDVALDGIGIAFAFGVTIVAAVLSGLLPALRASTTDPVQALREGSGATNSLTTQRLRSGLVMVEAALAVVLLVDAGLLVRSFSALLSVDPGYDSERVLIAQLDPGGNERDPEAARLLAEQMLSRVRAMPGVMAAGASNMTPLGSMTAVRSFELPSESAAGGKISARATAYVVTTGFAEALSLRLKEGRLFGAEDVSASYEPLIVNEEFVHLYLNDGKPAVGRQILGLVNGKPEVPTEIVGVVQNLLKNGLDQKPLAGMFGLSHPGRGLTGWFQIAIRTSGDPTDLAPSVRALVSELDPLSTVETATLTSRVDASVAQPRFAAQAVGAFATLAMLLAAAGLYGALSYSVSQRGREMAVRSALGAARRDIVKLVVRQGLVVTSAGLLLGIAAAGVTSRLISALLFGVTTTDPAAFLAAPAILLVVATLACLIPAWQGASVPPAEALRCE